MVFGCFFSLKASSLVIKSTSLKHSILGIVGLVPAAIITLLPFIVSLPTFKVLSAINFASTLNNVVFLSSLMPCSISFASLSTIFEALLVIFLKSIEEILEFMPNNFDFFIVSATSALWIIILDGIHPLFKQVPPIGPFSTTATFMPISAAAELTFKPEPAPMTIKSKDCILEFIEKVVFKYYV